MPDVIWSVDPKSDTHGKLWQAQFVSPAPNIVYGIELTAVGADFQLRKSVDGGATWANVGAPQGATVQLFGWYYDQWTEDETGTLIHCVYLDSGGGHIGTWYFNIDTSDDSFSAEVNVDAGDPDVVLTWARRHVQVIKKRDGNLVILGKFDNLVANFLHYRSTDEGLTWSAPLANPFEGDLDMVLPSPGYELDPADYVATYYDVVSRDITLKTYDDSANTWSESAALVNVPSADLAFVSFDLRQRWTNQSTMFFGWNDEDDPTADLIGVTITGEAVGGYTFTPTADVQTNQNESYLCAVTIDQQNDDIYVAFAQGGIWLSSVTPKYRRSTDGGVTWEAEVTLMEGVVDDYRSCWQSGSINNAGGEIIGWWYNDDTVDCLTNVSTAISIPAVVTPSVEVSRYGSPISVASGTPLYGSPIDQEVATLPQYAQVHANRSGFPAYGQVRVDQDGQPSYGQTITKLS